MNVPKNFPVKVLRGNEKAEDKMTCSDCGRSWNDAIVTEMTPVPSGRCPFEQFHENKKSEPKLIGMGSIQLEGWRELRKLCEQFIKEKWSPDFLDDYAARLSYQLFKIKYDKNPEVK